MNIGGLSVCHRAQVTVTVSGEQLQNNFVNPMYRSEQCTDVVNTSSPRTKPVEVSLLRFLHADLRPSRDATPAVWLQESKWSLFKRKLKPSATFENSYSEVSVDPLLPTVPPQPQTHTMLTEPLNADEGREARGTGHPWPRAVAVCPARQTPEEGSSQHLLTDRGQFQRHSQPGEGGQRRITPLSPMGRTEGKKHTLHRIYFFMQPV